MPLAVIILTIMTARYSVAPVDTMHCAGAVSSLWSSSLTPSAGADARRKLERLYRHNPAEPGLCLGLRVDGVKLRQSAGATELAGPGGYAEPAEQAVSGRGDAPVGVIGILPRIWHCEGERLVVGALADFAVASEHRSLGPALQLMRAALSQSRRRHAWLYGRPNPQSAAVCKRAGLREIGSATRFVKLLRSESVLRGWWQDKTSARVAALVTRVSAPSADAALWCADRGRIWLTGAPRHWEDIDFARVPLLSGGGTAMALDRIWDACERQGLCLAERSAALVHWRFGDSGQAWRLALARDRRGAPQGYVVWRLADGVAWVGDFLARRPLEETGSLLAGFAHWLRGHPVRAIDIGFFGHPGVALGLQRAGFRARPIAAPIYASGGQREGGVPPAATWYATLFDEDVDG